MDDEFVIACPKCEGTFEPAIDVVTYDGINICIRCPFCNHEQELG